MGPPGVAWYAGRDSNPHLLVYKTKALKAFARLPLSYRRMRDGPRPVDGGAVRRDAYVRDVRRAGGRAPKEVVVTFDSVLVCVASMVIRSPVAHPAVRSCACYCE